MSDKKRERSVNFGSEEVELLTSLVAQHKNILENKKSDAVTWNEKEQCWKRVEGLFNSTSGVIFRSAKTLKAKYEGLKRETRKKSATIRAETYRTGGGTSTAPSLTPIQEKVKDLILLSVDGIESQFDSDHVDSTQVIKIQPNSQLSQDPLGTLDSLKNETHPSIIIEYAGILSDEADVVASEHQLIDTQPTRKDDSDDAQPPKRKISRYEAMPKNMDLDDSNDKHKWNNWNPKSLRSKKHPALSTTKPKMPFERVAEAKLEIAALQKTLLEEELQNKRKQWAFEEEERVHKKDIWNLEKKYWLNKQ